MADLLQMFADTAAREGGATALVEPDGTEVSFADLKARADHLAAGWRAQGLQPDTRVLLAMRVRADLYAALAALWQSGATAVLPEPAMGLKGLRHALHLADVGALAAAGPYRWLRMLPGLWFKPLYQPRETPGVAHLTSTTRRDLALISFTSGSTGLPKAIPRSHAFLWAQAQALQPLLHSDRPERDLVAFPVFALLNLAAGRCSVLPNWTMSQLHKTRPAALAGLIARRGVTRALLPPALVETLAQSDIPDSLHTVFTGGGPVFPAMIERLQAKRPDLRVVAVYGSTEAEPIAQIDMREISDDDRAAMRAGQGLLAGPPVRGLDLRLQAGEILVAGAHVNAGYLDPARDAETKIRAEGRLWHRTGDAGRLDAQGRLWLLGRFGADVAGLHPFAIETAARDWPGVTAAALADINGRPVLAIVGDARHLPDWQARAAAFGALEIRPVARIPLDRRHRSKVDYPALKRCLAD